MEQELFTLPPFQNTSGAGTAYPSALPENSRRFRGNVVPFVKQYGFTFLILCCDVRNDVRVQPMFSSSLVLFVLSGVHVKLMLFACVDLRIQLSNTIPIPNDVIFV